jgi:hypothetical protein
MSTISRHCCHAGAGTAGSGVYQSSFPSLGDDFLIFVVLEMSSRCVTELEVH